MPKIAGMSLVAERPHNKYGSAILIRDALKVDNVYEKVQGTIELITIVMSGEVVHSVYKPPNDQFALLSAPYVKHTKYHRPPIQLHTPIHIKQHTGPLDVFRESGASAGHVEERPGRAALK